MDHLGINNISNLKFGNITLLKPIMFPNGTAPLRLVVEKTNRNPDTGKYRIEMYPGGNSPAGIDDMYSSIEVESRNDEGTRPRKIDVNELIDRCNQSFQRDEFYSTFWDSLFTIGEDFRMCDTVWRKDGELAVGVANPRKFFSQNHAHYINQRLIYSLSPRAGVQGRSTRIIAKISQRYRDGIRWHGV